MGRECREGRRKTVKDLAAVEEWSITGAGRVETRRKKGEKQEERCSRTGARYEEVVGIRNRDGFEQE